MFQQGLNQFNEAHAFEMHDTLNCDYRSTQWPFDFLVCMRSVTLEQASKFHGRKRKKKRLESSRWLVLCCYMRHLT